MKKIALSFVAVLMVMFFFVTGCQKSSSPTVPANTPTTGPTAIPTYTDMVLISGGVFVQQSDVNSDGDVLDANESYTNTVASFKLGKYETTYDLWYTIHQWAISNGYTFAHAGTEGYLGSSGTPGAITTAAKNHPVTYINWRDAIVWCNAYSEMQGLTPCYTYTSAVIKDSTNATACDNAVCAWTADGYRLPTESEWQYAASYINGSSWTPFNYVSGATADYTNYTESALVGWFSGHAGFETHATGLKNANAAGLYDMSGNVLEWCWDWNGNYPGTSDNYKGPSTGTDRQLRGGGFTGDASYLKVGHRRGSIVIHVDGDSGFRVAKSN